MNAEHYTTFDPTGPLDRQSRLIEASAGTGKTYSITDLVLRLVAEQGVALPEILIVTFTRAATSELRERVRGRLVKAVEAFEHAVADDAWIPDARNDRVVAWLIREARTHGDGELRARLEALRTAREEFDEATISTIHGFCQETLRRSAFETGVDFGAELAEDLTDLLEEVTHDFAVRELREADDGWYRYLREKSVTKNTLLDVAYAIEAEPHLRILPDGPDVEPRELWERTIAEFRSAWQADADDLVAWMSELCESKVVTHTYTAEKVANRRATLDGWAAAADTPSDDVAQAIAYFARGSIEGKLKKDRALPEPQPVLVDVCDEFLALLDLPASLLKARFAMHVRGEVERRKRSRNILSFNDLLRSLADALDNPEVGSSLRDTIRDRYQAALIDEFQDTDQVQWRIFRAVFGEDAWLHLIGDPKQAIYSFRGADVATYLDAAEMHVGAQGRLTLETNWRSDRRFVEALNALLDQEGVFGTDRIGYVKVDAADHHSDDRLTFPDGEQPTLLLRFFSRELFGADQGKPITKGRAWDELPRHVAREIVELLESGAEIHDEDLDSFRPVEPRDIAVLTRTNKQAAAVQEALVEAGVHAVTTGGGNVLNSDEAKLVQRFLDAVLRPNSEREVKSALSTPLFGVDAVELVKMSESDWEAWLEDLSTWSAAWRDEGVVRLVQRAFSDHAVAERLLRLPDGERRITNVLHIVELLHRAEIEHRLGPTALTAWLRTQRHEEEAAEERELRLESDEEAVQVVTIHRAKGLEFPVVWCPYLWDGLLLRGNTTDLRLHDPETGDLLLDLHVSNTIEPSATHKLHAELETWQENLRLLYVALTRAKHRCVVYWGAFTDAGTSSLGHVLHGIGDGTDDDGRPVLPDAKITSDDTALLDDLGELEQRGGGTIAVERVTSVDGEVAWSRPERSEVELRARTFHRDGFDDAWGRTSYSSLIRPVRESEPVEGSPAAEGFDYDDKTSAGSIASAPVPSDAPQVPLAGFERGARAGIFLHDVLEHLDFTTAGAPGRVEETINERLGRHSLGEFDVDHLADALRAVVATPLGALLPGIRLADIAKDDRLDELTFDLAISGGYEPVSPTASISLPTIAAVFERHDVESPAPIGEYAQTLRDVGVPRESRGFLNGAIDLVFRCEVDGRPRYFIADHKSNWLGDRETGRLTVHHYHPAVLRREMVHDHYVLQYHLYTLALHRYLRWRLGDSYDYERDVGGALYLFLRGMVGPETPDADGSTYGVYTDRPSAGLIADLDALFARGPRP
jgi:exodeoxyribonuclease V beta subunit